MGFVKEKFQFTYDNSGALCPSIPATDIVALSDAFSSGNVHAAYDIMINIFRDGYVNGCLQGAKDIANYDGDVLADEYWDAYCAMKNAIPKIGESSDMQDWTKGE